MMKHLMLLDQPVMDFDLDNDFVEVINNDLLPFSLRDYVVSTRALTGSKASVIRDWLASRTLNLSRTNAKVILNVAVLPQGISTRDKLKICYACKGLSMSDAYWLREGNEKYRDVNLRKMTLCDASYQIAVLGKHVSATAQQLRPDLSTEGMFPKFWKRNLSTVELWKTDRAGGVCTEAELTASRILDDLQVPHVKYRREVYNGDVFAVCSCLANDNVSIVPAQDVFDWCEHTGITFESVLRVFWESFNQMCVVDFIIGNTDRHFGNWYFYEDNGTGELLGLTELLDHNQALICDYNDVNLDELIYEPLGTVFGEIPNRAYCNLPLVDLRKYKGKVQERYERVAQN